MEEHNTFNPFAIILAIFELIFLIIIITSTISIINKKQLSPSIKINDISDTLPNLPKSNITGIESELYRLSSLNTDQKTIIKNSGATIRKGSITESNEANSTSGKFIVDIENLKHSYLVQYEYSNNGTNTSGYPVLVSCPKISDRIYNETCFSDNTTTDRTISSYLPYSSTTPSGHFFSITKDKYFSPKNQTIIVISNTCNDQALESEINSTLNSWIENLNLKESPKIVKNYLCDREH